MSTSTSTSITTTTSTTTTITTPVKTIEKNNKVEETKETTTTTTKTITTTVTPNKADAKTKKIVNKIWNDKDPIRAQLFRDNHFCRYGPETKATEIHGDPEREYCQYNLQTIQRKVREIRLLVKAYRKGVWLDEDPNFEEQCQLHRLPTDEEKKGREEGYERWEKLHPGRLPSSDLEELLGDFVALSVKSGVVKV